MPFATALANRWEDSQFPNWDQKYIDRMVTDSPWARTRKITVVHQFPEKPLMSSRFMQLGMDLPPVPSIGRPRVPSPGPTSRRQDSGSAVVRLGVELIIRWASALPVRRALVLQQFGRDGLDNANAQAKLSEPADFVIELAGIPHLIVTSDFEKRLAKARLYVPGRRAMAPREVEIPSPGVHVTVRMTFARVPELTPDSGSIGLTLDSGPLRIDEEFKLRTMVYQGRVEL
jgi:hypothetical protein